MKKSSIILLGYGLGYVIISILVAIDFISLSSQDILPLSIASLIFSLAEFWNVGVRLIMQKAKRNHAKIKVPKSCLLSAFGNS